MCSVLVLALGCPSDSEPDDDGANDDPTGADGATTMAEAETSEDPSATGGMTGANPTTAADTTGDDDPAATTDSAGDDPDTGETTTGEPAGPVPCQSQEGAVVVGTQTFGTPAAPGGDPDIVGIDPAAGGGFIEMPDGGGDPLECDVWEQDCPDGEKCNPWSNNGASAWNALRCVPIADNPGQPGDSCMVEGSGVSGLDDCALGAMCFGVDSETNVGECVELCSGNEMAPVCETLNTTCTISNGGVLILCRPLCNPLANECPDGQACYPNGDTMVCSPDASGDQGAAGEPCEFINGCDPGTYCALADVVPGCGGSGCCTSYCTQDDSECLPGQSCTPLYPGGAPAECLDGVGGCSL